MQRVQVRKSEQISPDVTLTIDYDQPITKKEDGLATVTSFWVLDASCIDTNPGNYCINTNMMI